MNQNKACCFLGHRKIKQTYELTKKLIKEIEKLISEKNVCNFYFGSKSEFDNLCIETVAELKKKYPHIKRIYIRSSNQYISDRYKDFLLNSYEDTYFPEHISKAGKASYAERNYEMINKSDYCVFYYDKTYLPPKRKHSKKDLTDYQQKSGTKLAYDYAVKNGKEIINVFE